ncbi:MAG: DUF4340 domain-containing protein [Treponema sp.]|jgi:hypothetical protein|nr:DUF4340 domain-containing protein [Treponema sp.]
MSRKNKTLIIAMGVLILLAGVYYWSTVKKNNNDDSFASYSPPVILGNLVSIELEKIEIPGITLEKKNEIWELVSFEGGIPQGGIPYELDQGQIQYMTYSLASVWTDRLIDEAPEDLSIYGLDKPSSRVSVTDSAGRKAEYLLGDMTPSRDNYYIMEAGDPRLFTVSAYQAENMQFTLESIRQRSLFPSFNLEELTQLRIESAEARIEIRFKPEPAPPHLAYSFSPYILASPYLLPRGVNRETLQDLVQPFNNLAIRDFIDEAPSSLAPYGLNQGRRIFLQTRDGTLDLLLGNDFEGKHYAKLSNAPGVFTLSDMESVMDVKPFSLIEKFLLLVNIDTVARLTISGGDRNLSADFQGKGEESVFFLNGRKAESRSFRTFYQAVISLLADAEYSGPARQNAGIAQDAAHPQAGSSGPVGTGEITIEYRLNTGGRLSISLIPYNRDFYTVRQEGSTEFLVSRNQVRSIYEAADKVVFE